MTVKIIRIATRKSPLALWQANHVAAKLNHAFPNIQTELVTMLTQGDKILDTPLAKIGGKGLFVKELEQGMLAGKADIAVHSMKDVPVEFPQGLHLAVILKREDPRDAFVSNQYVSLNDLPENAKIGTCSLRRQCQLKERFPNAQILPLRGNVNTRLAKLEAGEFDAIILAAAGLKRLQMQDKITECLATDISLPAIGQGAIGIESRSNDVEINRVLAVLKDDETTIRLQAERAMNARLNGGCQVPIAGFSEIKDSQIWMRGLVGNPDGSVIYRAEKTGKIEDATQIGVDIADDLLAQGADKVLAALYA
ncbi:MAG: hydroxymethylbilane synthase [Methylococcales bacterium]|nr:hydroxymethylbilane synthase [Methylococcales bacterium]